MKKEKDTRDIEVDYTALRWVNENVPEASKGGRPDGVLQGMVEEDKDMKLKILKGDDNKSKAGWEKLSRIYAENTLSAQVEVAPEVWEARKAFIEDTSEIAAGFMDHRAPSFAVMPPDGESTRIVDRCIQEYFKNGITYVYRGRGKKHMKLHEKVFEIFDKRMEVEHPEECYNVKFKEIDVIWCFVIKKVTK